MDKTSSAYKDDMQARIKSEQMGIVGTTNADLVCRDCLLRYDDSVILGNVSRCEEYPVCKPISVLVGKECDKYVKE